MSEIFDLLDGSEGEGFRVLLVASAVFLALLVVITKQVLDKEPVRVPNVLELAAIVGGSKSLYSVLALFAAAPHKLQALEQTGHPLLYRGLSSHPVMVAAMQAGRERAHKSTYVKVSTDARVRSLFKDLKRAMMRDGMIVNVRNGFIRVIKWLFLVIFVIGMSITVASFFTDNPHITLGLVCVMSGLVVLANVIEAPTRKVGQIVKSTRVDTLRHMHSLEPGSPAIELGLPLAIAVIDVTMAWSHDPLLAGALGLPMPSSSSSDGGGGSAGDALDCGGGCGGCGGGD